MYQYKFETHTDHLSNRHDNKLGLRVGETLKNVKGEIPCFRWPPRVTGAVHGGPILDVTMLTSFHCILIGFLDFTQPDLPGAAVRQQLEPRKVSTTTPQHHANHSHHSSVAPLRALCHSRIDSSLRFLLSLCLWLGSYEFSRASSIQSRQYRNWSKGNCGSTGHNLIHNQKLRNGFRIYKITVLCPCITTIGVFQAAGWGPISMCGQVFCRRP